MYKVNGKEYPCCTSVTMGLIGGKWKSVILFHLMEEGPLRYGELRKRVGGVTERTLSIQLKQLEEDKIVSRKVYTKKPPLKVEYALTGFGKSMEPLLKAIANWGECVVEEYAEKV